ncbi:MAG: hypothetical protein KZQ93_16020 [Candidatus Thiodiazotropha sp. (ex Monitilora ramsayi)]|nr:hypothetical protein [Candidatus Thiodiazotropha sp. (ex Monitilora ramsayi)]
MDTVSLHPSITHQHLITLLKACGCEMKRIRCGKFMILPRENISRTTQSNVNFVKFPHSKTQFAGTTLPTEPDEATP